ncbi:MAG: sigma 54-interacting transcriptional regulator [Deltaproteobacteria bacterium]|nr:sigma 54-interacting transcriptional regulator [Deltaproteobacteria bacterium]
MAKPGLLIFDGDETARGQMRWAFSKDYDIFEAATRAEAVDIARTGQVPVGIMDLGLPPKPFEAAEGVRAVRDILSVNPIFKAVVVTGLGERDDALRAIDLGAFDFFTKPISIEEVRLTVRRALHTHRLQMESMGGQPGASWPGEIIGLSQPMQEVFSKVRKLAEVNIPVLIQGESGTGKETLARAVHRISSRHSMPFVKVACDSMPEPVLAEELFGRGAEQGKQRRKGWLELADGGTLYLEEAGVLSPAIQKELQERLFARSTDKHSSFEGRADTRVISSSTRDLKAMVRAGDFSQELYNRLGIITLSIPPLRDRGEDIYMLSLYFLKKHSKELARPVMGYAPGTADAMAEYAWPGKVREMENRIRRAVSLSGKKEITSEDLAIPACAGGPDNAGASLTDTREAFRKRMINEVLGRNFGNVSRTANELGISRQYLSRLIARFNIKISR